MTRFIFPALPLFSLLALAGCGDATVQPAVAVSQIDAHRGPQIRPPTLENISTGMQPH